MSSINSSTHLNPRDRDLKDTGLTSETLKDVPTLDPPSRPDLTLMTYRRHMDEVKSIITFLGSLTSYEVISHEINEHIKNLIK